MERFLPEQLNIWIPAQLKSKETCPSANVNECDDFLYHTPARTSRLIWSLRPTHPKKRKIVHCSKRCWYHTHCVYDDMCSLAVGTFVAQRRFWGVKNGSFPASMRSVRSGGGSVMPSPRSAPMDVVGEGGARRKVGSARGGMSRDRWWPQSQRCLFAMVIGCP